MSAEQLVVLALLVAAFVAGWVASPQRSAAPSEDPPPSPPEPPSVEGPEAAAVDAGRLIDVALERLVAFIDVWLDGRWEGSPEGRQAFDRFEGQPLELLGAAATADAEQRQALRDAAAALIDARVAAERYRAGLALDASTNRTLAAVERRLGASREDLRSLSPA